MGSPSGRPSPAPTRPRSQWETVLIGAAFGFGAGVLLITGIILLISAISTPATQTPVGNKGANATPAITVTPPQSATATSTPTATATRQPTPTRTPVPSPTSAPTSGQNGGIKDDPRFYIFALLIFLLAGGIFLARKK